MGTRPARSPEGGLELNVVCCVVEGEKAFFSCIVTFGSSSIRRYRFRVSQILDDGVASHVGACSMMLELIRLAYPQSIL